MAQTALSRQFSLNVFRIVKAVAVNVRLRCSRNALLSEACGTAYTIRSISSLGDKTFYTRNKDNLNSLTSFIRNAKVCRVCPFSGFGLDVGLVYNNDTSS